MALEPFHGVRTSQSALELGIAQPEAFSTIGKIMAVDPTELPSGITVNDPIAIRKPSDAATLPDTVREELDTVFDNRGGTVVLGFTDEGADGAEKAANAQGDATAKTGVHMFTKAVSKGLPKPKLLTIPLVATAAAVAPADGVIAELAVVAGKLEAMAYVDGPGTTIEDAKTAVGLIANRRVVLCDDKILKSIDGTPTARPSSSLFAAIQSQRHREQGVHWGHDNAEVAGIVGVNRPLTEIEASELSEAGVAKVVNFGAGFKTWGPFTTAVGTPWEFSNVVIGTDYVNGQLRSALEGYIGRPTNQNTLVLMRMSGERTLRNFEASGVLLPGSVFQLAPDQSAADGAQGITKWSVAFEVPSSIYDTRLGVYRNISVAYEALFNSLTGQFQPIVDL